METTFSPPKDEQRPPSRLVECPICTKQVPNSCMSVHMDSSECAMGAGGAQQPHTKRRRKMSLSAQRAERASPSAAATAPRSPQRQRRPEDVVDLTDESQHDAPPAAAVPTAAHSAAAGDTGGAAASAGASASPAPESGDASAYAGPRFASVRLPEGRQQCYDDESNKLIAAARASQPSCTLPELRIGGGRSLRLEVRFAATGGDARGYSMVQVDLDTDNAREVVELPPADTAAAAATQSSSAATAAGSVTEAGSLQLRAPATPVVAAAPAVQVAESGEEAGWAKAEREWTEKDRQVGTVLGEEQSAEGETDGAAAAEEQEQPRDVCFEVVGWIHALKAAPPPANPAVGDGLTVSRQPDNPRDANALIVRNAAGQKLGYLHRELAALLSPAIERGPLQLGECVAHRWSDHGRCVLRAQASSLPRAACAFEIAVDATDDDDAPRDQLSEFQWICKTVLELDKDLFTPEQQGTLVRLFARPASKTDAAAAEENTSESDDAARFVIRLLNRKGPWFRVAQRSSDMASAASLDASAEAPWSIGMPWVAYPRLDVDRALHVLEDLKLLRQSPPPALCCPQGANAEELITESIELSCLLDKDELKDLVQRVDLAGSIGGAAAGGGASSSRAGICARIAETLKLQLAPPTKSSIRSYFQAAQPKPAAASSSGVTVSSVCVGPLRSTLRESVLTALGTCIQLEPTLIDLLKKVELLFYLENAKLGEPNTIFLLERIGAVKFASYTIHRSSLFENMEQLEEYMRARKALEEIEEALGDFGGGNANARERSGVGRGGAFGSIGESDDAREARNRAMVAQAEKSAAWLTEHGQWDRDQWDHSMIHPDGDVMQDAENATLFQRRFRAAWVHARVVRHAVGLLEAKPLHEHQKAVDWLRKLLRSPHIPSARPRLWNRLTIDLAEPGNLDEPEEAWAACKHALTDPWLADRTAPEYAQIRRRFLRLSKKLRKSATIVRRGDNPNFSSVYNAAGQKVGYEVNIVEPTKIVPTIEVIRGGATNSEIGVKSTFWGYDDEMCSVEELALQHYASEEGGGWVGVHDEGAVLRTLFGLSLWPAIFADMPGVFQTQFQSAPLDLCTDAFYPSRRKLIEQLLARVKRAESSLSKWGAILGPVWEKHNGCCCAGVSWERVGLATLVRIAAGFGGNVLEMVFRRLAVDYKTWASGLPDLLLWQPPRGDLQAPPPPRSKFSEVKSQRDRPSEKQSEWITALTSYKAPAQENIAVFLHVSENETAEEEAEKREIASDAEAALSPNGAKRKKTAESRGGGGGAAAAAAVVSLMDDDY